MARKVEFNESEEIRKELESGKLVIGTEVSLKELKKSNLAKVYVSSNCPEDILGDLEHYAPLANTELIKLIIPNDELGVVCKKPFAVSILGLLK